MKQVARVIGLMALFLAPLSARAEVRLEQVRFERNAEAGSVEVRLHTSEPVRAYSEPTTLVNGAIRIILFDTALDSSFAQDAAFGPIARVHAEPSNGHLIVYLVPAEGNSLRASAYLDVNTSDVVLRISDVPNIPVVNAAITEPPGSKTPAEPDVMPVKPAGARWKLDTIVIDAGHGGHDDGAVANGIREKDVTLAVALKLGREIEQRLGCRVIYTRDDDHFVTLRERGHIANREGAKLFISIHANAASSRAAAGTETYFLGMHKTEAARAVMERENGVVALESDPGQYGGYDEGELILHTLAQSAYMRKSEELAGMVETRLTEATGSRQRGVKQAGFYVLWSASMPSILVELGFVTNPREAVYLGSARGQESLADAIFRAVRDFKEQYESDLDVASTR